jgi:anti-sigma B factor antagonist
MREAIMEQTFHLVGEIDLANAHELHARLEGTVLASAGDLIVDASRLDFIDSSGLSVLADIANLLIEQGRRMRTVGLSLVTRRAIDVVGLVELLGVDRSVGAPRPSFGSRGSA